MSDLLLSKNTARQIDLILKSPPHAVLITGPAGSGKLTVAQFLVAGLLGTSKEKLNDYPYFIFLEKPAGKQEIPIDAVREVIKRLGLKAVINSQNTVKQIVLIDEAHLLSQEAQNALLKIIEEPPAGTVFLMTSLSESAVLPTIASRSQKLKISSIGLVQAKEYFNGSYSDKSIESAWQLSGGAVGLLNALLQDDSNHPLKQSVETAKKILRLNRYERSLLLDGLSADKAGFNLTLTALVRVLAVLHRSAVANGSNNSAKLLQARHQVDQAIADLELNTSPKLIALNLALRLPV